MFRTKSFFQSTANWHSGWLCVLEVVDRTTDPDFGRFDCIRKGAFGFAVSPRRMRFAGLFRPWLFVHPKPAEGGAIMSYRMAPAPLDTVLWGGLAWLVIAGAFGAEAGLWPALAWSAGSVSAVWTLLLGAAYLICGGPRQTLAFVQRALPEGEAWLKEQFRDAEGDEDDPLDARLEEQ